MKHYRIHRAQGFLEGIPEDRFMTGEEGALEIMGAGYEHQLDKALLYHSNLSPDFFDLKSGVLGKIMQKFANYRFRVAFVVRPEQVRGRFAQFVQESHLRKDFAFFFTRGDAVAWLDQLV